MSLRISYEFPEWVAIQQDFSLWGTEFRPNENTGAQKTSLGDSALTAPVMVMFRQHIHAKGKFTNRVEANALSEVDEKSGCVV
jgi:hypothetical protein